MASNRRLFQELEIAGGTGHESSRGAKEGRHVTIAHGAVSRKWKGRRKEKREGSGVDANGELTFQAGRGSLGASA